MKKFCLKAGIFLLFFGGLLAFTETDYVKIAYNEPVDIYGEGLEDASQIERGLAIDTDVQMLMECFASEETTTTRKGGSTISTDTDYYYTLPIFVDGETYYVGFCVDSKNEHLTTYDKMVEETMAYLYGESSTIGSYSVEVSGGLKEMDEELYAYMQSYFRERNLFASEAEMEKYVLPLTYTNVDREATKIMLYISIIMLVGGAAMLLYAILGDRKYSARRKQFKKLGNKTININGINYNVDRMDTLDRKIWSGQHDKAKKELMQAFKASDQDAERIIAEWEQITGIPF